MDPVNARIALLLDVRRMSQSELARRIGVGPGTVQRWAEVGVSPNARLLAAIPAALKVSGHWLLTGEGPMEPPGETPDLEAAREAVARQVARELEARVGQVVREVLGGYSATGSGGDHLDAAESVPPPAEAAPARGARSSGRGAGSRGAG